MNDSLPWVRIEQHHAVLHRAAYAESEAYRLVEERNAAIVSAARATRARNGLAVSNAALFVGACLLYARWAA